MPTVHDVAGCLLRLADRDRSGIAHLKLQKLVYYAQAFHLGSEAEPLFRRAPCTPGATDPSRRSCGRGTAIDED